MSMKCKVALLCVHEVHSCNAVHSCNVVSVRCTVAMLWLLVCEVHSKCCNDMVTCLWIGQLQCYGFLSVNCTVTMLWLPVCKVGCDILLRNGVYSRQCYINLMAMLWLLVCEVYSCNVMVTCLWSAQLQCYGYLSVKCTVSMLWLLVCEVYSFNVMVTCLWSGMWYSPWKWCVLQAMLHKSSWTCLTGPNLKLHKQCKKYSHLIVQILSPQHT